MGVDLPGEREMRRLREVADFQRQLDDVMRSIEMVSPHDLIYDVQEALEQHRRIQSDLQPGEVFRSVQNDLQEAAHLRETLRTNGLDLASAMQQALDQHERIQDALGDQALESAVTLAEVHSKASMDMDLMAKITEQLDADYFARTLRCAQEMLSDNTIAHMLAQADIQAIIREAENAMDGAVSEPGEFAGEIAVGPPEWMRHLSRENLRTLIKLLMLSIETFYACYCVSLALSEGNIFDGTISDSEVQAVVHVLLTTLGWAYYLLEHGKNDD